MKISPTAIIVTVCLLLSTIPLVFRNEPNKLEVAMCDEYDSIDTIVDFYIDERVLDRTQISVINDKIKRSIRVGNRTLANSCIPMRRVLGDISIINVEGIEQSENLITTYNLVWKSLTLEKQKQTVTQPNRYFGVIIDPEAVSLEGGVRGYTWPIAEPNFFVLSSELDMFVLEHELSHLGFANHEEEAHEFDYDVASELELLANTSFARATKCGGLNTMGYSWDSFGTTLPIYSSPGISYGEVCGDAKTSDNARQLRNYANYLKQAVRIANDRQFIQAMKPNTTKQIIGTWQCIISVGPLWGVDEITFHSDNSFQANYSSLALLSETNEHGDFTINYSGRWLSENGQYQMLIDEIDTKVSHRQIQPVVDMFVELQQDDHSNGNGGFKLTLFDEGLMIQESDLGIKTYCFKS
jgi:hypothetical protein